MDNATEPPVNDNRSLSETAGDRGSGEKRTAIEYAQDHAQWNDLIERKKKRLAVADQKPRVDIVAGDPAVADSDKL